MSKAQHTAGTWTAEHDFSGGIAIVSTHRRIHVAHVNKHAGMVEEDTANANLITAAPDMLAVLQAAIDAWRDQFEPDDEESDLSISGAEFLDWFTQWRETAKAVVAAAEGRS